MKPMVFPGPPSRSHWTPHRASLKHEFKKPQFAKARTHREKPQTKQGNPQAESDEAKSPEKAQLSCQLDGYFFSPKHPRHS